MNNDMDMQNMRAAFEDEDMGFDNEDYDFEDDEDDYVDGNAFDDLFRN